MEKKWRQATIDIGLVDEAEKNANRMSDETFNRLVENIRRSGGLSSAIACYRRGGRYVIISGHHRYRACVKLRHKEIPVIYADEKDLTKDEIIALQLSHNSLHGEDDKGILRRLFEEIQSVDFKEFAHIDAAELANVDFDGVSFSAESEHFTVSFVLFRNDYEALQELLGIVKEEASRNDLVVLADGENTEEPYLSLARDIEKSLNIRSSNITLAKIIQLAKERLEQIKTERND